MMYPTMSRPATDNNVSLTSHSSTTPTIREVWRTVQPPEGDKMADEPTATWTASRKKEQNSKWMLQAINIGGIVYYLVLSTVITIVTGHVTLPTVYRNLDSLWRGKFILYFMYTNMMLNYTFMQLYGRTICTKPKKHLLPTHARSSSGRSFCERCQANVAARAKHCAVCDLCVLKRDHHCFFSGCCVGFQNQRYFVVFCVYAFLGSFFSLVALTKYLQLTYADIFSYQVYKYLLPWCLVDWAFRGLSSGTLAMVIVFYMTIPTSLGCLWFAGQQFVIIYRGQTIYEYLKGIKTYRTFPADHFRSVFGPFWASNFIFPMPWFQSSGNGKDWNVLKHV